MEEDEEITVVTEREPLEAREDLTGVNTSSPVVAGSTPETQIAAGEPDYLFYIGLPVIFLTVALFGGMRISLADGAFLFNVPPLACLLFGAFLLILFFRAGLIEHESWFSNSLPVYAIVANAAVLIALYAAAVQVFNSLMPEQGIPFWVVGFCFLWTLWNNLFAGFDARRLMQSTGGIFVLAFAFKYMVLINFATVESGSWWQFLTSGNMTREAVAGLLQVPPYSGATGYIQFFALALFFAGLYFLKPKGAG